MIYKFKNHLAEIDKEEQANFWTHFIGLIMTLVFGPILIWHETQPHLSIGLSIFVIGLIVMYLSSSIYHLVSHPPKKALWQLIDHISIFVLISCSYTAFIYYHYNEEAGFRFLLLHWAISVFGIIFKIIARDRFEMFSLILYIISGWLVAFVYRDIIDQMSFNVMILLIFGGVCYMIGIVFYLWERMRYNHAIWHIFVILGTVGHYLALLQS